MEDLRSPGLCAFDRVATVRLHGNDGDVVLGDHASKMQGPA